MIRVKCKSGLSGWQSRLRDNYGSYDEWLAYAELFGLHIRLGFKTPLAAWRANPVGHHLCDGIIVLDFRLWRVLELFNSQLIVYHQRAVLEDAKFTTAPHAE